MAILHQKRIFACGVINQFLELSFKQAGKQGGHLGHLPPENSKHCRTFQIIKMKLCILIIFEKRLI